MSNLWLNISLGRVHLQIGPDFPWVRFSWNGQVRDRRWNAFEVHCLPFGLHAILARPREEPRDE